MSSPAPPPPPPFPPELLSSITAVAPMSAVRVVASAGKGVTQVIERCEAAKTSGYLDLSSCSLMYLADAIYLVLKGYDVTKCNLRDNAFKKFPKKLIDKFPRMTILNVEGNEVAELPEEMASWSSLKGLNVANNQLTAFPSPLYELRELAILDLSGNQIQEVDVDRLYASLPKLVQLNISGNPLSDASKARLSEKRPKTLQIHF